MRRLAWMALALVAAAVLCLPLWLRSQWGRRVILSQVVRLAGQRLDGRLSIARLEGGLLRELTLHDVRLYDREGQLAIELAEVHAEYRPTGLLRREPQLHSLRVHGARVHARLLDDGRLNLLTLVARGGLTVRVDELQLDGEAGFGALTGTFFVDGRDVRWKADAPALGALHVEVESDAQELDPHLQGRLRATLSASGDLTRGIDSDLRVTPPTGELHAQARLSRTPQGRLRWQGSAEGDLDPGIYRGAPHGRLTLAATADGEDRQGSLVLRQVTVEIGRSHARASGRLDLPRTAELQLAAGSPDLTELGWPGLAGTFDAHAHISRADDRTRVDVALHGGRLQLGDARVESFDLEAHTVERTTRLRLSGRNLAGSRLHLERLAAAARAEERAPGQWDVVLDDLQVGRGWRMREPGRLHVGADSLEAQLLVDNGAQELRFEGALTRTSGALEASLEAHALDVAALATGLLPKRLPPLTGRAELRAEAHGSLRKSVHLTLQLNAHHLALGDAALAPVRVDAEAEAGDGGARAGLEAKMGDAALLVARASTRRAALEVDAEIPGFDLSKLPGLAGSVDGSVALRGSLNHPVGHATLHAHSLVFREQRFAQVGIEADWNGGIMTAAADAQQSSGGELHLKLRAPADAEAPLSLAFSAHAFRLAVSNLDNLRELDGTLDADLRWEGPRAHALLSGSLKLEGGKLSLAGSPRVYDHVAVELAATDGQIELHRLQIAAGDGTLSAHGRAQVMGVHPESVDVAAELAHFPVSARNLGAWVDAGIELHGARAGDRFDGTLRITHGGARLPQLTRHGRDLQPLAPLEDVHFGNERPSQIPLLNARVVAHLPGPFKLRSPELEADVRGQLDILLVDGDLRLHGQGETTWGHIELFGRRYEIERARVDFDGSPDPKVDVRLIREITGTTIVIEVHGTAESPKLELASDPPIYDSSQVIGILLSGDPGNLNLPEDRTGTLAATQDTIARTVSHLLVHQLSEQFMPGLPIELRVQAGRTSRVEVGHQITDRVYLRYSHNFGETGSGLHQVNANEAAVQIRLRPRASLSFRYGDAGVGGIDVFWMLRF
jgi:autotransporter translocation and assembly factor TamB